MKNSFHKQSYKELYYESKREYIEIKKGGFSLAVIKARSAFGGYLLMNPLVTSKFIASLTTPITLFGFLATNPEFTKRFTRLMIVQSADKIKPFFTNYDLTTNEKVKTFVIGTITTIFVNQFKSFALPTIPGVQSVNIHEYIKKNVVAEINQIKIDDKFAEIVVKFYNTAKEIVDAQLK